MIATLFLIGVIITERNDVTQFAENDVGCLPPPAYTFVGPDGGIGIDRQWIPYGTDTHGTNEYVRLTSNLVGVVASSLAGAMERRVAGSGDVNRRTCLMRPIKLPASFWSDNGEYLVSVTNTSLRLADQLNLPMLMYDVAHDTYSYYEGSQNSDLLEEWLNDDAPYFGSRLLDYMTGDAQPPISTTWFSAIPYKLTDTNLWKNVWPTYNAVSNDLHFFIGRYQFPNIVPLGFAFDLWWLIWGTDVVEANNELRAALKEIPLDYTLEDVLGVSTGLGVHEGPITNDFWLANQSEVWIQSIGGWRPENGGQLPYLTYRELEHQWRLYDIQGNYHLCAGNENSTYLSYSYTITNYNEIVTNQTVVSTNIVFRRTQQRGKDIDDFDHWKYITTRLDWKRLGIICQLERQMEITYRVAKEHLDMLPYQGKETQHSLTFETYLTIPLPDIHTATQLQIPMSELYPDWSKTQDYYHEDLGTVVWTYPTCRVVKPDIDGGVLIDGDYLGGTIEIDTTTVEDMFSTLAVNLGLTNGVYELMVSGIWTVQNNAFNFSAQRVEDWGTVTYPSNTVTFKVDGESYPVWNPNAITNTNHDWRYYDSTNDLHLSLLYRGGNWDMQLSQGENEAVNAFLMGMGHLQIEGNSGSISMSEPPPSFTAVGDGDCTNWMWIAEGIAGTNCTRHLRTTPTAWSVTWDWEDGTYINIVYDDYYDEIWFDCIPASTNPNAYYNFYATGTPRRVSFPSFSISWDSSSYQERTCIWTNESPAMLEYTIPIPYDITNTTVTAHLGIDKRCKGGSTNSDDGVMPDVKGRFRRYPEEDWDRIHAQRRPTVECMISDVGDKANVTNIVAQTGVDREFNWDAINRSYSARRQFRLSPEDGEARREADADQIRFNILHSLDEACKRECVAKGGWDIKRFNTIARIGAGEQAEILDAVQDALVKADFVTTVSNEFYIAGTVTIDDDATPPIYVQDPTAGYNAPTNLPAWVGTYEWKFEEIYVPASNNYESVRADGVQAPVTKTTWKFKNLRDPSF